MIAPNIIIPFDGAHADVPSGFTRDTRFDGKYPKGAETGLGDSGGAATHTHTVAHIHAITSHTHAANMGTKINGDNQGAGVSGGLSADNHTHPNGTTGASGGETCQSTTMTTDATASDPPFYTVIFIKASSYSLIPTNGMIFHTGTRTGLTYHTASENKFLKGAATGADAAGTGGAASHVHTQSHTHTANVHSHATGNSGGTTNDSEGGESGANSRSASSHSHTFTVQNGTQNLNANTTDSESTSVEPLHKTIKHYKATGATPPMVGDIAMTTDAVPTGWVICDGNNSTPDLDGHFIKNTQTAGTVAGANTHSHVHTHSHTGDGTHGHTANSPSGYGGGDSGYNGSGETAAGSSHQHNGPTITAATANYDSTTTTSSTDNNEPPYVKVQFIMMSRPFASGQPLMALLENTWTY